MTLKKYEQVVGVMVKPAGICTLEGLSALNGVTLLLPSTTTLYEAADVDAELAALRQQLAEATKERNEYKRKYELVINDSAYGECCEVRAKAEAERDDLKAERDSLYTANVRLVKTYDAIMGTPCEQIRHSDQVTDLTRQLVEARDLAAHAEFERDHYELVKQRLADATELVGCAFRDRTATGAVMSWHHYQARRRTQGGQHYYDVIEVYRESVCGPAGRTVDGVLAGGGTKAELIADLERMLSDVKRYRTIVEKETP